MRIVRFEAENVKRLRAVAIVPPADAAVVEIAGRNGQGKSSVLDAILYAIGGKAEQPDLPVRIGETTAHTTIDLGDLVVHREWRESGSQVLRVQTRDGGTVAKAQERLDSLIERISFDPLGFAALPPAKQRATLAAMIDVDLDALDGVRRTLYNRRAEINADAAREEAAARSGGPITGAKAIDEEALWQAIKDQDAETAAARRWEDEAAAADARCAQAGLAVLAASDALAEKIVAVGAATRVLEAARGTAAEAEARRSAYAATPRPEYPNPAPIREAIRAAQATNARVRTEAALIAHGDKAAAIRATAADLTRQIEDHDADVIERMRTAPWPIEGLGLDAEHGITYRGVPLTQCSSAERIRVACAIGVARTPGIRVMLIREASLLDAESMAVLASMAADHDFQIWMERVGSGGAGAIIIEDGGVLGGAVPAPESSGVST